MGIAEHEVSVSASMLALGTGECTKVATKLAELSQTSTAQQETIQVAAKVAVGLVF